MIINKKSIIINHTISVKDGEQLKPVMTLYATLNTEDHTLTISRRILDKDLYDANMPEMEKQYDDFILEIRGKEQETWTDGLDVG